MDGNRFVSLKSELVDGNGCMSECLSDAIFLCKLDRG